MTKPPYQRLYPKKKKIAGQRTFHVIQPPTEELMRRRESHLRFVKRRPDCIFLPHIPSVANYCGWRSKQFKNLSLGKQWKKEKGKKSCCEIWATSPCRFNNTRPQICRPAPRSSFRAPLSTFLRRGKVATICPTTAESFMTLKTHLWWHWRSAWMTDRITDINETGAI